MDEDRVWEIRAFIYRQFAETAHPPHVDKMASFFSLTHEQAAEAYNQLQQRHAILLSPGTHDIQMAWPFSGVETPFKVRANGKTYFANCAWDSFGIPVVLRADAEIEASCAQSSEPLRFHIANGQVQGSEALVHLLVPFQSWYDDLPFT